MSPQEYIKSRLKQVKELPGLSCPENTDDLQSEILRLLLSKKFRKYSANQDLIDRCKQAILTKVSKDEPVNVTFLQGAYKLWRLEESPHADWAELFALMYYTNWIKGICEIYEPGVHFDFFVDDWIIPKLDNVSGSDVTDYLESYNSLLRFLKPYQPKNLNMTITPVGSQFESKEVFEALLEENLEILNKKGLPELTEQQRAMVELNVKVTPEQEADPDWQRKVWQLHNAYGAVKKSPGYHYRPDKILAFTQPLPSGTTISVGTTKASIMKSWIGVGVLQIKGDSYSETVLSSNQIQKINADFVDISIEDLNYQNFNKIRVVK